MKVLRYIFWRMNEMKPDPKRNPIHHRNATFYFENLQKYDIPEASPVTIGCMSFSKILPLISHLNREVKLEERGISKITTLTFFSFLYFSNLAM